MGRPRREKLELRDIFPCVQQQMLAQFALGSLLHHPSPTGAAAENQWIEFFNRYLPSRYAASSAFVISADGRRSRQIDIAIYDRLYSPMLFPHDSGLHIPAESVYAVFEVKQELDSLFFRDAAAKALSVRVLQRTSVPVISAGNLRPPIVPPQILAGILAVRSPWGRNFRRNAEEHTRLLTLPQRLDFGCALHHGAFEVLPEGDDAYSLRFSPAKESLIFFFIRLVERLRALGTAPAADLMAYARALDSLRGYPGRSEENVPVYQGGS